MYEYDFSGLNTALNPVAPLPALAVPEVEALLRYRPAHDWLRPELERLRSSPRLLDKVSMLGTAARLWSPPVPTRATVDQLLADRHTPAVLARAWVDGLDRDLLGEIAEAAIDEASALDEALCALSVDSPDLGTELLAVAKRRDSLESVLFALTAAGTSQWLAASLAVVDATASDLATLFTLAPRLEDERLATVSWTDPDAWWGALAA